MRIEIGDKVLHKNNLINRVKDMQLLMEVLETSEEKNTVLCRLFDDSESWFSKADITEIQKPEWRICP